MDMNKYNLEIAESVRETDAENLLVRDVYKLTNNINGFMLTITDELGVNLEHKKGDSYTEAEEYVMEYRKPSKGGNIIGYKSVKKVYEADLWRTSSQLSVVLSSPGNRSQESVFTFKDVRNTDENKLPQRYRQLDCHDVKKQLLFTLAEIGHQDNISAIFTNSSKEGTITRDLLLSALPEKYGKVFEKIEGLEKQVNSLYQTLEAERQKHSNSVLRTTLAERSRSAQTKWEEDYHDKQQAKNGIDTFLDTTPAPGKEKAEQERLRAEQAKKEYVLSELNDCQQSFRTAEDRDKAAAQRQIVSDAEYRNRYRDERKRALAFYQAKNKTAQKPQKEKDTEKPKSGKTALWLQRIKNSWKGR